MQYSDWSRHYRLYSKGRIDMEQSFRQILRNVTDLLPPAAPLVGAVDDTIVRKRGKKIPGVGYLRDPLGPPIQVNLVRAQRLIQFSASLSEARGGVNRMIPVLLRDAAPIKKPPKKAPAELWAEYRRQKKEHNLSTYGLGCVKEVRGALDESGQTHRPLWLSVDGSHTNKNFLRDLPHHTCVVGRVRCNAKLHYLPQEAQSRSGKGRGAVYGPAAPTPEELQKDQTTPWQPVKFRCNGRTHHLRIKTINHLLWRVLGEGRLVRLIVIAPLGYRLSKQGYLNYREPAYLVCTDVNMCVTDALKTYLKRWDIEVNFRDEKSLVGVGQAQVRNQQAVKALPQMAALAYAALQLASIRAFGIGGQPSTIKPPKWYPRHAQKVRPSTKDLISQLRKDLWAGALRWDNFSGFAPCSHSEINAEKLPLSLESALFATSP